MFGKFKYLMKPEDGGAAGGGAPAGGAPAGGDSSDPLFGGGAPPAPPAGGAPAGGAPPTPPVPPAGGTPDWRASLPEDLRKQPFMEKYQTPEALAKAYGNLEKMIGMDKVVVPQKGAKFEDPMMRDYLERVGLPKTAEDYKIEGFDPKDVDPEFLKGVSAEAHKLGVLPEQMKGIISWFTGVNKAAVEQATTSRAAIEKARLDDFKKEAGDAYTTEIARAQAAVKTLDAKDQEHLKLTGLSKDPAIIKILAKFGATLSEDQIRGEGGRTDGVLNPTQAREKIAEIRAAGLKHPYYDKAHVEHEKAKKDMQTLYGYAFPNESQSGPKK
jgi:hypothetical protein